MSLILDSKPAGIVVESNLRESNGMLLHCRESELSMEHTWSYKQTTFLLFAIPLRCFRAPQHESVPSESTAQMKEFPMQYDGCSLST